MLFWVAYFIGLTAFSLFATYRVLAVLKRRAIMDAPNERSNHDVPTPRGGGIAVMLTIALGWAILVGARPDLTTGLSVIIMASAVLLATMSWVDDTRGLSASVRLPVHLAACALGVWALPGDGAVFQGLLPTEVDWVLSVLVWAGFLNFFNFMDGIDGITAVETTAVAGGLFLIAALLPAESLPQAGLAAVAAAAVGFLFLNWSPARLFMGDVGSVPLGYLLGWFLLFLAAKGYWAPAVILPAYYLADAGITLIRRAARGEKVWQAHREHFYQRAVAAALDRGDERHVAHRRISAVIALLNAALVALAAWSLHAPVPALALTVLSVGGTLWWMNRS
ncbi:MAG: glycosyltransferase family 4 protein [Roseitalea porphyridii]